MIFLYKLHRVVTHYKEYYHMLLEGNNNTTCRKTHSVLVCYPTLQFKSAFKLFYAMFLKLLFLCFKCIGTLVPNVGIFNH